jgi:hypothetical protein
MAGKESRYWKLCIQIWLFIQLSNESTLVTKLFFFFFLFYKIQIDPWDLLYSRFLLYYFYYNFLLKIISEIKIFFSSISSLLSLLKFYLFRIIYKIKDFFQFHLQLIFSYIRFDYHSFNYYLFYIKWFSHLFLF